MCRQNAPVKSTGWSGISWTGGYKLHWKQGDLW